MFLRNSLHVKRYKTVLHDCCRLLNIQVERQPLTVNAFKPSPAEKKLVINDIESKLACFMKTHYNVEWNEVPEITTSLVSKKYFTLKKSSNIRYSFTVDDHVAEKIVNSINTYIAEDDLVLEVNPGLGLITHHLLKSKAKQIHLTQSEELMPSLKNLIASNEKRLSFASPKLIKGRIYDNLTLTIIDHLLKLKKNGQKLKVVLVLHETRFFPLFLHMIMNERWHDYEDLEFYVILSPSIRKNSFSNKYRKYCNYALFHTLMHCEMLCELPRQSFLPWPKKYEDSMYLYKITKHPTAFDVLKKEDYKDFYQFLKILGRSKYNFIIPTLEHWSPGCGADLIKLGITTWTQVIDLPIERAAHLYNLFKLTPEYENYKMVISNEHKGLVEIVENEDERLGNEIDLEQHVELT